MGQGKVEAIMTWLTPATVKELQYFLGFINFSQCFVRGLSAIAAPLTTLLKGNPSSLNWNQAAEEAFSHLKQVFTTTPVLKHPNPSQPFVVEVDASDAGVGATL